MKIKELIELAKKFPPDMDIAFWDIYAKDGGYSLDKILFMSLHTYPNGHKEVLASIEGYYS